MYRIPGSIGVSDGQRDEHAAAVRERLAQVFSASIDLTTVQGDTRLYRLQYNSL